MSITALAKQKFGKPLAASALALSMAFAPMASNDAQAADIVSHAATSTMKFERTIPRPTLPAKFRGANYRTDNPKAIELGITDLERRDAPSAASDDRLSLTIYGGNSNTKAAVQDAGRMLAERVIGVTYIELDDNDSDPNTAKILICADGRCVKEINTPIDYKGTEIIKAVVTQAIAAYREQIEPYLVDELPTLAAN